MLLETPPLSLYVHFPWCVKKCPYCDFNSHSVASELDQPGYVDALLRDLDFELAEIPVDRKLVSIFMGGGTPSLFTPDHMHHLLSGIEKRLTFDDNIEVTMETNPATTEHHDFSEYRAGGINRLSIGAQTFNAATLKILGRIHSSDDTVNAFQRARDSGFDNINLDIMFGLPNQTRAECLDDLDQALSLAPGHLSCYQLTLEPNTVFYRYPPALPAHDQVAEMASDVTLKLADAGYSRYEISAYYRENKVSRHNMNYWQFGDYLGIGAGAHGKITHEGHVIRRSRKKHPASFQAASGTANAIGECQFVDVDDLPFEFLMNSLRLRNGFNLRTAELRTGISASYFETLMQKFIASGLIQKTGEQMRCTDKGYQFLDTILEQLL